MRILKEGWQGILLSLCIAVPSWFLGKVFPVIGGAVIATVCMHFGVSALVFSPIKPNKLGGFFLILRQIDSIYQNTTRYMAQLLEKEIELFCRKKSDG